MTLLEVRGLDAGYGDFQALFGIDVDVAEGETLAMIGANGAGKTTFLRVLAGQVPTRSGSIVFDGADIAHVKAHRRVGLGIALVPEGRKLFGSLTVRENLLIGAHSGRTGRWNLDTVLDVFPLIRPLLDRPSHVLSGGEQQAVAIGRALMSNPRLVLLDEVSLGLAPVVVKSLYEALPALSEGGATVLLVEQDIGQALEVASRVVCLLEGRVSLEGRPADLARSDITAAYFGLPAGAGAEGSG